MSVDGLAANAVNLVDLNTMSIVYLLVLGFVGGLVSGFIGSGGAFVLTPGMMSLGVPALVAVASNMCHKFPKALVGALKRGKLGHVDLKLGLFMGATAEVGVLCGAVLQERIKKSFGDAGSDLYVSLAFVVVLAIVGGIVLMDGWRERKAPRAPDEYQACRLAKWVQSINIPGTMVYFNSLKARVSVLFVIPLGFATGMLAATIAVGGFIGVPSMMYVLGAPSLVASGTELVIAFVMGLGGTAKFAMSGLVDIRLAMIILGGSLFGIQLGAMATTYVKSYMIALVMGAIMVTVLVSRLLMIPVYLARLEIIQPLNATLQTVLQRTSFIIMVLALVFGAGIILRAIWRHHAGQGAARDELVED
jgi:uncharacterized membrane protein YfcA